MNLYLKDRDQKVNFPFQTQFLTKKEHKTNLKYNLKITIIQ